MCEGYMRVGVCMYVRYSCVCVGGWVGRGGGGGGGRIRIKLSTILDMLKQHWSSGEYVTLLIIT